MSDEQYLRGTVETYVDGLYLNSALLRRDRDTAVVHLLRAFEDAMRSNVVRGLDDRDELRFFQSMRWSHEALPWALRWTWAKCESAPEKRLDLNWTAYQEAGDLLKLSFNYYQLYRCFVLYSSLM